MRKYAKSLAVFAVALAVMVSVSACLDSVNWPDDGKFGLEFEISGSMDFYDVTSATLILTNWSRTIRVTDVKIHRDTTEEEKEDTNDDELLVASFTNKPQPEMRKATYLKPTDKEYRVDISWASPDGSSGTINLKDVLLYNAAQVTDYHLFLNKDGDFVASETPPNTNNADPDDLGKPSDRDPDIGEGSTPAVIPEGAADRLGYYIVINRTQSQKVDRVEYTRGDSSYTMGAVATRNRQSISLGNGQWTAALTYTLNGSPRTLSTNINVFPASSPQAPVDNYLYFYLNNKGEYKITTEWPPVPNDVSDDDLLPEDKGFGRGLIKVINNTYTVATTVDIWASTTSNNNWNLKMPAIPYGKFAPPAPVQFGKTGYVDVVGTNGFPIKEGTYYLIMVTLETLESTRTIQRLAYLKDQVVTVIINEEDINDNGKGDGTGQVGATVNIINRAPGYEIVSMEIVKLGTGDTLADQQRLLFGSNSWETSNTGQGVPIVASDSAQVVVLSTTIMPIWPNDRYHARLMVKQNSGEELSAWIIPESNLTPSTLYSTTPKQNQRVVELTPEDIARAKDAPDGFSKYITVRFYNLEGAPKIKEIWFEEVFRDANSVPERDKVLPGTSLRVWQTGRTGYTVVYKVDVPEKGITKGAQWHYGGASDEVFYNEVIEQVKHDGHAYTRRHVRASFPTYISNDYRDVTLNIFDEKIGWYLYPRTKDDWFVGYASPAAIQPSILQNMRFFIDPIALSGKGTPEKDYFVWVDNSKTNPRVVPNGTEGATRVLPIGRKPGNITGIMKESPTGLLILDEVN